MSEHDELGPAGTDDDNADEADVEAHGLRGAAVTGLSAAAMIAGAGDALAATSPEHASASAKQAVYKVGAANKHAVFKGSATNKTAALKGNSVAKWSVSKEAVDPSSRRGRDAS